jgi:hypothetical protein
MSEKLRSFTGWVHPECIRQFPSNGGAYVFGSEDHVHGFRRGVPVQVLEILPGFEPGTRVRAKGNPEIGVVLAVVQTSKGSRVALEWEKSRFTNYAIYAPEVLEPVPPTRTYSVTCDESALAAIRELPGVTVEEGE